MSGTAIVWLIVGLLSTATVAAVLVALVRHVLVLGRSLRRFRQEIEPLTRAITEEGNRASSRRARLSGELPFGRS